MFEFFGSIFLLSLLFGGTLWASKLNLKIFVTVTMTHNVLFVIFCIIFRDNPEIYQAIFGYVLFLLLVVDVYNMFNKDTTKNVIPIRRFVWIFIERLKKCSMTSLNKFKNTRKTFTTLNDTKDSQNHIRTDINLQPKQSPQIGFSVS